MQIGGGAAEAARKAAEEAARRAAEAAKRAAEAAQKKAAEAQAHQAAAAQHAQQHQAQPADMNKAATQSIAAVAGSMAHGIHQADGKNTCAAANKEKQIAENNPELHAKMVKDLKEKGSVDMPGGQQLHLSQKNAEYIDKQHCSDQDKDSMRVQAAMMDYANQHEEYDMAHDVSKAADNPFEHRGLTQEQTTRLDALDNGAQTQTTTSVQAQTFTRDIVGVFGFGGASHDHAENVADTVTSDLHQTQQKDQELTLNINTGGGMHSVTVTAANDANNTVTIQDTNRTVTLNNQQLAKAMTGNGDVGEGGDPTATLVAPPPPPPPPTHRR